jgi:hypothetical protein
MLGARLGAQHAAPVGGVRKLEAQDALAPRQILDLRSFAGPNARKPLERVNLGPTPERSAYEGFELVARDVLRSIEQRRDRVQHFRRDLERAL